jgi:polysaccharide biosynthesis protein PslG
MVFPVRSTWIVLACAAACVFANSLAGQARAQAADPPPPGGTRYGVHMDLHFEGNPRVRQAAILKATELRAEVSRSSFLWHRIEAQQGSRDWRQVDDIVDALERAGMTPLFSVYGSPSWANGAPGGSRGYVHIPPPGPAFDLWVARYAGFMSEAAARYRGRVRWELWNEQNYRSFWLPRPDVDQYARWYAAVRAAILAADPAAEISVGGLAGLRATSRGSISGMAFLRALVERGVPIDAVSVHPYPSRGRGPEAWDGYLNNFSDIQLVRDYLVGEGRPVPLWVTEWGWSTERRDPTTQAAYIETSLRMIATRYPFVRYATIFMDRDLPPSYEYGLYDHRFAPKPSGLAFERFVAALRGVPSRSPSSTPTDFAPRVENVRIRGGGGRVSAAAQVVRCLRCRVHLVVRAGGRPRWRLMRRRGGRYRGIVRGVRRGRVSAFVQGQDLDTRLRSHPATYWVRVSR